MDPTTDAARDALGLTTRAAAAVPSTLDAAAREVDVTFSTGARVRNYVSGVGYVLEELDMSPNAIRLDKLRSGAAPVLDTHGRYQARDVLGSVVSARLVNGEGIARLRFSAAADVEPIWQRVAEGTLRTVSVGYRVHRYEINRGADGAEDVYRAVDWEPFEISVVPIPADAGATVRAANGGQVPPTSTEDASTRAGAAARNPEVRMDPIITPGAQGAPNATPPAAPPAPVVNAEQIRAEAVAAERARVAGLRQAAEAGGALLGADQVRQLLEAAEGDAMATEATLRAQIFDAAVQAARGAQLQPAQRIQVGASHDAPEAIRAAMADALVVTMLPGVYKPQNDAWRAYAGWRPSAMVAELMRARGERDIPRDPAKLAERAFAAHTTSDFPLLLQNSLNRALLVNYELAPPTYRRFMARRSFSDFRAHTFLRVGDFPALLQKGETGEIKSGTIGENKETITLATYARKVMVSREVVINDTLGAFSDFAGMIGRRVADFENATAFAQVNTASGAGPTLLEGSAAVFSTATGRKNKAASGGAIDVASVAAGRAAMREQTSLDGLKLNLSPALIVTGSAYETDAEKLVASVTPAQASQVNPFAGRLQVAADANIPGNRWYLFAEPGVAPVYVYGYLAGAEGPQTQIEQKFGQGVELAVLLDFACGAIDYRGGYFNAGA